MGEANIPDEIIEHILTYLPVKPLIRFTCVSKRFRYLILSDPKFAQSQFEAARDRKTLNRRLLYYSVLGHRFESVDLESQLFGGSSSVSEIKLPFQPPRLDIKLLGSCNGFLFLSFGEQIFYMWNPSTGFFKTLPDPGISLSTHHPTAYGIGYFPATNDYKVCAVFTTRNDLDDVAIFSSSAQAWETLKVEYDVFYFVYDHGVFFKEALHWMDECRDEIFAFHLGQAEGEYMFRQILLPRDLNDGRGNNYENHLGVSAGGCLSLARHLKGSHECIDVWVMGEYRVRDSWVKLYNLRFPALPNSPKEGWNENGGLFLETNMVAQIYCRTSRIGRLLVKNLQNKNDKGSILGVKGDWFNMIQYKENLLGSKGDWFNMIQYQESLLRIKD